MGTEDRDVGAPGAGRARADGDPLRMSEAEKRMAEWEARHDVAARGHRPAPDVLQHYLAHERLVHGRLAGEQRPSTGRAAATAAAPADRQPTAPAAQPTEKGIRGLLRRLFRRHD